MAAVGDQMLDWKGPLSVLPCHLSLILSIHIHPHDWREHFCMQASNAVLLFFIIRLLYTVNVIQCNSPMQRKF